MMGVSRGKRLKHNYFKEVEEVESMKAKKQP